MRRKAAARIEASLDRAAKAVVALMEDAKTPPAVKLAAAKDLLDRGGLTDQAKLETGMPRWQAIFQNIVITEQVPVAEVTMPGQDIIDAEIVDPLDDEGGD